MKKLNFLHKILIALITLSTANFVLADDKKTENNLNLDSLVIEKLPHLNAKKKGFSCRFIFRWFYGSAISNCL